MTPGDPTADFKSGMRAMYAAGSYERVAELEADAAGRFVRRLSVGPGLDVLDVGTGTGNVAIPARQAGGRVVGLDLTPEQLEVAQHRATRLDLDIDWVEGDAEDLPFPDHSFDRVLSAFAVMFAPRHERAASELARVCRPGGLIGVCSWTPDSIVGRLMDLVSEELPPPPHYAQPPLLWGTEEHVEKLFGHAGIECEFERDSVDYEFSSPEGYVEFFEANFGPLVIGRSVLSAMGRWEDVRERMIDLLTERGEARGDIFRTPQDYLIAVGCKHTNPAHRGLGMSAAGAH